MSDIGLKRYVMDLLLIADAESYRRDYDDIPLKVIKVREVLPKRRGAR